MEHRRAFGFRSGIAGSGKTKMVGTMSRRQEREQKIERCLVTAEGALRAASVTFSRAVSSTTLSANATEKLISLQSIATELQIKAIGRNAQK